MTLVLDQPPRARSDWVYGRSGRWARQLVLEGDLMTYDEFIATLRRSEPQDWTYEAGIYPFPIKASAADGDEYYVAGHSAQAHYKPDLDISLVWGAEHNGGKTWGPGHGGWGENFPDSEVYGLFCDLRWRGQVISRELVCHADGGRYYMPIMDGDEPEGGWGSGNPITRWKVRPGRLWLPRLLQGVAGSSYSFNEGLEMSGAVVVDY